LHDNNLEICWITYEVFMAVKIKIVTWIMTMCTPVGWYQSFRGTSFLHPKGRCEKIGMWVNYLGSVQWDQ
jgi:hypothetical protein